MKLVRMALLVPSFLSINQLKNHQPLLTVILRKKSDMLLRGLCVCVALQLRGSLHAPSTANVPASPGE